MRRALHTHTERRTGREREERGACMSTRRFKALRKRSISPGRSSHLLYICYNPHLFTLSRHPGCPWLVPPTAPAVSHDISEGGGRGLAKYKSLESRVSESRKTLLLEHHHHGHAAIRTYWVSISAGPGIAKPRPFWLPISSRTRRQTCLTYTLLVVLEAEPSCSLCDSYCVSCFPHE